MTARDVTTLQVVHLSAPPAAQAPRAVMIPQVQLSGAVLTPDGRQLVAQALGRQGFGVWDTATGKQRVEFPSITSGAVQLAPDGKVLAFQEDGVWDPLTQSRAGRLTLWDIAAGKPIATREDAEGHRRTLTGVVGLVAAGSPPHPLARLAPAMAARGTSPRGSPAVHFSPDGKIALLLQSDRTVLLEASTGREVGVWKGEELSVPSGQKLPFSPDGKVLAAPQMRGPSRSEWTGVRLLEVPSGRLLGKCAHDVKGAGVVLFTPDGKTLLTTQGGPAPVGWGASGTAEPREVKLWDAATGRHRATLERVRGGIELSPDGGTLLAQNFTPDAAGKGAGEVAWWEAATGRERGRLRGVTGPVAWSPDGKEVFAPVADGVRRLRASDGKEVARFDGAGPPIAITPDGQALLASVPEGVRVWDVAGGQQRGTVRHQAAVTALGLHPEGDRLISVADGQPKFWDVGTGKEQVAPAEDPRESPFLLDGRVQWARYASDPSSPVVSPERVLWPQALPGTRPVLATDRFRLVAQDRALELWPQGSVQPEQAAGAAAEMARGTEFVRNGRLDEAVAAFRKAARLAPADAEPRMLLADTLDRLGRPEDAGAALDEACKLAPSAAWMFGPLAESLLRAGRPDRALAMLDRAVQHRPQDAALQFQRAEALAQAGATDRAAKAYQKAVELYPAHAEAWGRLADALLSLGRPEEARGARQRAGRISLYHANPEREKAAQALVDDVRKRSGGRPVPDFGFGALLLDRGFLDEAIYYLRKGAFNRPNYPDILSPYGLALARRGQYTEALGPLRRAQKQWPGKDLPSPWDQWLRDAERGAALDALLAKVLRGDAAIRDAAQLMELAQFATQQKGMFAAAARLFRDAFGAHPEWAAAPIPPQPNGLPYTNRRFAADVASMASAGEGDAADLSEERRAVWRRHALAWLRAELVAWRGQLEGATPEKRAEIRKMLADTQVPGDYLAPVRDGDRLDRLDPAERDAWRQLWADVDQLRNAKEGSSGK
jgi:Flp pilus assembly protein TadD/WD40 repeat protein